MAATIFDSTDKVATSLRCSCTLVPSAMIGAKYHARILILMIQGEDAKLREQNFHFGNIFPCLSHYALPILYRLLNRKRN